MAPIVPQTQVWTWDEYAELPDDGKRYQVLDGDVFVTPNPSSRHQRIVMALAMRLVRYVEVENELGKVVHEVNLVMGAGRFVNPDIVFVPSDRADGFRGPDGLWLEAPPALVMEVLSPATRRFDRVEKRRAYAEFGVDEYWVVDPERERVEVHRSARAEAVAGGGAETCHGSLVWGPDPGVPPLELDLRPIWKT